MSQLSQYMLQLRTNYTENLVNIVRRCMAQDPQDRPHSVYAVQKMLAPLEFFDHEIDDSLNTFEVRNPWSERIKSLSKMLS